MDAFFNLRNFTPVSCANCNLFSAVCCWFKNRRNIPGIPVRRAQRQLSSSKPFPRTGVPLEASSGQVSCSSPGCLELDLTSSYLNVYTYSCPSLSDHLSWATTFPCPLRASIELWMHFSFFFFSIFIFQCISVYFASLCVPHTYLVPICTKGAS